MSVNRNSFRCVERRNHGEIVKMMGEISVNENRRGGGRPKKNWIGMIKEDMKEYEVDLIW